MFTGSALKVFVTGAVAVGSFVIAGEVAEARPLPDSPVLRAEMQRRDWSPGTVYAPPTPRVHRPDWRLRSDFPPLVAEMNRNEWQQQVTCVRIPGLSAAC